MAFRRRPYDRWPARSRNALGFGGLAALSRVASPRSLRSRPRNVGFRSDQDRYFRSVHKTQGVP
jgi:hypothetical protein